MLSRRSARIAARLLEPSPVLRPVFVLLTVVAAACHSGGASNSASNDASNGASTSVPPTGTAAVRLERGPCFGRCAEYVVELFDDGAVRFTGRRNVTVLGAQQGRITSSAVRALQQRFTDAGFATADSAYVEGSKGCGRYLPDGPGTVLGLRVGTAIKSVHLDAGCTGAPRFLNALAAQVDSVAQTSAWIASSGEKR
jgi:hypothetical protein